MKKALLAFLMISLLPSVAAQGQVTSGTEVVVGSDETTFNVGIKVKADQDAEFELHLDNREGFDIEAQTGAMDLRAGESQVFRFKITSESPGIEGERIFDFTLLADGAIVDEGQVKVTFGEEQEGRGMLNKELPAPGVLVVGLVLAGVVVARRE